eukprot:scaffold27211_cov63-Phaeocystis_antarctica.AAC.5
MPPTVAEVADVRTPLGRRDHLVATAQRQPVHVAGRMRALCTALGVSGGLVPTAATPPGPLQSLGPTTAATRASSYRVGCSDSPADRAPRDAPHT